MKTLTITSRDNLSILTDFINNMNLNIEINLHNDSLDIHFNEEHTEKLITGVSAYILTNLHSLLKNQILRYLEIDTVEDDTLNSLLTVEKLDPYIEPIKILLTEYLKDSNYMDIDSFITFNCRGLQQDIYKMGQDYISIYLSETNNNNLLKKASENNLDSTLNMVDSSIAYHAYFKEINQLFEDFSTKLDNHYVNLDYSLFETLHIKNISNELVLVDSNNKPIKELIIQSLPIEITKELEETPEAVRATTLINLCIIVFKTKCVIFHKSVTEKVISLILLYLSDSKDSAKTIEQVDLFKCNGCDFC